MTKFRPRNAYYLRVSTNVTLPLFLYLDERHVNWMSDVVLQHVLADLRPLIIPKLQAEKDVHFGPGATPDNKRGTVEVHRGDTYQFAYFFRKTEPHTVLLKSRHFVAARLEGSPRLASQQLGDWNPEKTGSSAKQSKRKRANTRHRDKESGSHLDEDEWSAEENTENRDDAEPISREPRPARKQRRTVTDACQDDDVEDTYRDVAMDSQFPEMVFEDRSVLIAKDQDPVIQDANDQAPDTTDIILAIEEEEKPKPLLKLKYQSIQMPGHCLCVVVEPRPPLRAEATLSMGLGPSLQSEGSEPLRFASSGPVITGDRAKTPLFLPEYDRTSANASFARERSVHPVPLFYDAMSRSENDDHSDNELMTFSQTLNTAGHMHTIAADDDDDMDGEVLFGDADEVRELLF